MFRCFFGHTVFRKNLLEVFNSTITLLQVSTIKIRKVTGEKKKEITTWKNKITFDKSSMVFANGSLPTQEDHVGFSQIGDWATRDKTHFRSTTPFGLLTPHGR